MQAASPSESVPESDRSLLERTEAGDRSAFGLLVARYQTLVCSIAYNACGDFAQSEDVAQETFLAAWKDRSKLDNPERFRAWLCGIARNLSANARRRLRRQPVHGAEPETQLDAHVSESPDPAEFAVSHEESTVVWSALERLPELYREPLILFYREGHSIPRVAAALDLSEEAVRQRLSRGRSMLREEVTRTIEGVLTRTIPGAVFTAAVLSALPGLGTETARAAALAGGSAAAAKGVAAAAKGTSLIGFASIAAGPLLGLLGGYLGFRAGLDRAGSEQERHFIVRSYRITMLMVLLVTAGFAVTLHGALSMTATDWAGALIWTLVACFTFTLGITGLTLAMNRRWGRLAAATQTGSSVQTIRANAIVWDSPAKFLGIPLISIRWNQGVLRGKPAIGWIALGDFSIGLLVSIGGISVGTFSFGGISLGALSAGGLVAGGLAFGGASLGYWAYGGVALGHMAVGGMAIASYAAQGGLAIAGYAANGGMAIAHELAVGGKAEALHANDAIARQWFAESRFFQAGNWMTRNVFWLQTLLILPSLLPVLSPWLRRVVNRQSQQSQVTK